MMDGVSVPDFEKVVRGLTDRIHALEVRSDNGVDFPLFAPAGACLATTAGATALYDGDTTGFVLPDAATNTVAAIFIMPPGFNRARTTTRIRVHWTQHINLGSGNVLWDVRTDPNWVAPGGGEGHSGNSDTIAIPGFRVHARSLMSRTIGVPSTARPGDIVSVVVSRGGADAADTYGQAVLFQGVELCYS